MGHFARLFLSASRSTVRTCCRSSSILSSSGVNWNITLDSKTEARCSLFRNVVALQRRSLHQDGDEGTQEALEKLRNLVDGWVLEGVAPAPVQQQQQLAITSGLLDEWNLDDWHDSQAEGDVALRDGTRPLLHQATVQDSKKKEPRAPFVDSQGKRVYGMDRALPSRVIVEFTEATSLSDITEADANKLFMLSKEDEEKYFSEGLPKSFTKEFDISCTNALLIRSQFLKLVNHFKGVTMKAAPETSSSDFENSTAIVENKKEATVIGPITHISLNQKKKLARERRLLDKAELGTKKQIILDGLPGSGKSVVLAMLVQWARSEGWLVCYIPSGRKWTHNELYYKNENTGLWDTPVQAALMLKDLLKSHSDLLEIIPCRVLDPIPLGEGPGIGRVSGPQEVPLQEGVTLKDLVQLGIDSPHASVGVVVRLRKELSLVEEVPVLIAVDEFNSWFTFSGYHESYNEFGRRQIHARELAMVHAFRDMTYGPFMVGAFSHSTNVGKLPKQLPCIPPEGKVFLNRYDFMEASVMLKHYMRKWCPKAKFGKRARRALYMLTNGNATELRDTAFLSAAGAREVVLEKPEEA